MKKFYIILFLIGLLITSITVNAQGVYNFFSNKTYEITSSYDEVLSEQDFIKNTIRVNCFQFKNAKTQIEKSINKEVKALAKLALKNENTYLKIYNEVKQRISVYNELKSSNNNLGNRNRYPANLYSQLMRIDCKVISVFEDKLLFEIKYEFQIDNSSAYNRHNTKILVSKYYTANLSSAKIKAWKISLNPSMQNEIQNKLSSSLNEIYSLTTSKLDYSDIELLEEDKNMFDVESADSIGEVCKDICERINLKDADFLWYNWGLIIKFQPFTYSSKIYNGKSFMLFLPIDEAIPICSLIPEFSFVKELKQPEFIYKKFDYYSTINTIRDFREAPKIQDILAINNINDKPKTLEIKTYQFHHNGTKSFLRSEKNEFNEEGQFVNRYYYSENGSLKNSEFYKYDDNANITSHISKEDNGRERTELYFYDENGNLIQKRTVGKRNVIPKRSGRDDYFHSKYFFYSGKFIYSFDYQLFRTDLGNNVSSCSIDNNEFCMGGNCYKLDNNGNLIGIYAKRNISGYVQIGRDKKGRIVEAHCDNDRYHYYHFYDDLDRMVKYQQFEYANVLTTVEFHYKGNSMLPYERCRDSNYGGNQTQVTEFYIWE
ncbi:MAG: hypothetical protein U9R42_10765 [Bacteroidota bacterium]|nr:hypothetical protein [Bacteroidota bacterium]